VAAKTVEYLQRVSRIRIFARKYWFELLIAALAVAGMIELIINRDSPGAPSVSLWFSVPAMAVLVLPLVVHRRYPFADEALRAGASGFVLKDDSPEQLIAAIRTVADGDALLSPTVTRRVIQRFVRTPRPTAPTEVEELSERERDVFRLLARGLSNLEIGQELYISETTVKTHVTHILQKLDLRDRVQAVVLAYETGLFDAS
jgi:DNA-binding NarL/FixJ family response regulator